MAPSPQKTVKRVPYYKYSKQLVNEAVESIKTKSLSPYTASKVYGIPRLTLLNYVSGKSTPHKRGGCPLYLNEEEQRNLSTYVTWMAAHGRGLTTRQVCIYIIIYPSYL